MTPQEQIQLQYEIQASEQAQFAYNQYFAGFFEQKEADLIQAFRSAPIGDVEILRNIQCLFKSLDSIKMDLLTKIETGKLAEVALANDQGVLQ